MQFAILLITYDHIIDAKIGMRLITQLWRQVPLLQKVDIFHAYNGPKKLYPKPYLEKRLIRRRNLGHYRGAADLINVGIKDILQTKKRYDYILVMSADVWLTKPEKVAEILQRMSADNYQLATSLWPNAFFIPTLFSSEFFIISRQLANSVFPLDLDELLQTRPVLSWLAQILDRVPVLTVPLVEIDLTNKIKKALQKSAGRLNWIKSVWLLPGRRVFWGLNRFHSPGLGYVSHHNLDQKIELCLRSQYKRNEVLTELLLNERRHN